MISYILIQEYACLSVQWPYVRPSPKDQLEVWAQVKVPILQAFYNCFLCTTCVPYCQYTDPTIVFFCSQKILFVGNSFSCFSQPKLSTQYLMFTLCRSPYSHFIQFVHHSFNTLRCIAMVFLQQLLQSCKCLLCLFCVTIRSRSDVC